MNCIKILITKCYESKKNAKIVRDLHKCNDKTSILTLNGTETIAKCTKCYDADTIHLVIPYNNGYYRWTCRLEEIDSAEIKSKDKAEQEHAIKSRDYLQGLILDKIINVRCGKFDKYGRLLVYISIDGLEINEHLVKEGYAYKYNGGTKMDFNVWCKMVL
jgi:endonuclease YncB( thermonuclease family)